LASISSGDIARLVLARPTARTFGQRRSISSVGDWVNSTVGMPPNVSASSASVEPVKSSPRYANS
jgi:hypothetical protein